MRERTNGMQGNIDVQRFTVDKPLQNAAYAGRSSQDELFLHYNRRVNQHSLEQ